MPQELDEIDELDSSEANSSQKKKRKKKELLFSPLGILVRLIAGTFTSTLAAMYNYEVNCECRKKGLPEKNLEFVEIIEKITETIGKQTELGAFIMAPINKVKYEKDIEEQVKKMEIEAEAAKRLGLSMPLGTKAVNAMNKE